MEQSTQEKVAKVDALRKQGMRAGEACKQVGINPPAYYWHKRPAKDKKQAQEARKTRRKTRAPRREKPTLTEIPVAHMNVSSAKVFVLFGDPVAVADAVRSLQ